MSEKANKLINLLSKKSQVVLKRMWDYYQTNTNGEKFIYYTTDDFSDVASDFISECSPLDFAEAICKSVERGKFNNDHIYFEIIPFEIFHSFDDLRSSDYFSYEELAEYILTANDDMGNRDIRKILNEPGISKNEVIKNLCEKMPHELVDEWNDYQKRINSHEIIMSMEDDFNSALKDFTPYELASLIGGSIQMRYFNPDSVYFYYDSIHNKLYSFDDPGDIYFFSLEELADHIVTTAE